MIHFNRNLFARWSILPLLLTTLACGIAVPALPETEPAALPPTRTPLPTFTPIATEIAQVTVVIPPTATPLPPTNTPIPTEIPPTEVPTEEPTVEPTPEPTATPVPPTQPPPPPPTEPPPPPTEPPPPPQPAAGANGVMGKISFRDGRNTYAVGERIFVNIEATNTTDQMIPFGILGLNTSDGNFQTSWDRSEIGAGQTFRHEDGVAFGAPGNHKIWLSICFSTKEVCQSPDGNWERFEPGVDVIVQ